MISLAEIYIYLSMHIYCISDGPAIQYILMSKNKNIFNRQQHHVFIVSCITNDKLEHFSEKILQCNLDWKLSAVFHTFGYFEVMIIDRLHILCVNKIFLQNSSTHTKRCSNWLLYYNDGAPQKLVIAYFFWLTKELR